MILINGLTHVVPGTGSIAFRAYQSKKGYNLKLLEYSEDFLYFYCSHVANVLCFFFHSACNSKITGVSSQEIAAFVSTSQVLEQIF